MSNLKQINLKMTDDEMNALEQLAEIIGKNKSATIRFCIQQIAEANNITIEEVTPKRGTYDRNTSE